MLEMSGLKRNDTNKLAGGVEERKGPNGTDQRKKEGLFTIVEQVRRQGTAKKNSMIMDEEEVKAGGSPSLRKEA